MLKAEVGVEGGGWNQIWIYLDFDENKGVLTDFPAEIRGANSPANRYNLIYL